MFILFIKLFIVTDATLFQDAPVAWQYAVERKCNDNPKPEIWEGDHVHRINNRDKKQVCKLFEALQENFEVSVTL